MSGNNYREEEWEQLREQTQRGVRDRRPRKGDFLTPHKKPLRQKNHFCKRDTMHICTACTDKDRQKTCDFHLPSSGGNHCVELRFEEFCTNQILHQYISGVMTDSRATTLVRGEKKRHSEIQSRIDGYHIIFPLEGEETAEDLQHIYDQLNNLGMNTGEFWLDKNGKSAAEHDSFSVTADDIKDGTWSPKRRELKKDILRYLDIREKLGY